MKDDLQKFHEKNMTTDPQYAIARHLFDLGEAVAQLREQAKMMRRELGKQLRGKARDIAIVEDETPRAPAGLLEAALKLLVQDFRIRLNALKKWSDSSARFVTCVQRWYPSDLR